MLGQAAFDALVLTPFRSAMVLSFVFAAFSSLRFVASERLRRDQLLGPGNQE